MNALFFPFNELVQHAAILAPISSVANLKRRSEIRTSFRRDSLSICRTGWVQSAVDSAEVVLVQNMSGNQPVCKTKHRRKTSNLMKEIPLVLEESHLTS